MNGSFILITAIVFSLALCSQPSILSQISNIYWQLIISQFSQEYPINAGVPWGFIPGSILFLLYINDLPDDIICNAICADDTPCSKCDHLSDL